MSHIEIVDPTRFRDSLQCLRLFYWRHERFMVPAGPRMPLVYGRGVHASLAAHYEGKSAGIALKAFEDIWAEEVLPFQNDLTEEDPKRNPARWMETFVLYRQAYRDEPFKVQHVEAPFFLPITDNIAVAGIIDLLVKQFGQTIIYDHKTTSSMSTSYFNSFNPNHQFGIYLLGASEILKQPITTLMVNCILSHATEKRPEKLFARKPTTRSASEYPLMKEEIINWWSIVQDCRRRNSWPRNDDRCQRWAPGCDYLSLCTEVNADYRKLKPSKVLFREAVWDPLVELRKKGFEGAI